MGAKISACGKYRYRLTRGEGRLLGFVMLNPSTADADTDDPTIRRCVAFARRDGYDGIDVANLYALRATDPAALKTATDPTGGENDHALTLLACSCDVIVCAWGTKALMPSHVHWACGILSAERAGRRAQLVCLGTNKDGSPKHPLYVPKGAPLVPWRMAT